MVEVTFHGGPRHNKRKAYKRNPQVICCGDEARAHEMHGLYRIQSKSNSGAVFAVWQELPQKGKTK
jgi:hypothetical protein